MATVGRQRVNEDWRTSPSQPRDDDQC